MSKIVLALLLIVTGPHALSAEIDPHIFQTPQDFAYTPMSSLQWWIMPDTNKVNFRRCDCDEYTGSCKCRRPMLLKGIAVKDLPDLLDFYCEHLATSSTYQFKQLTKILTGSFGTVTVYAGTLAGMSMLKPAMPHTIVNTVTSWPIRRGIHVVSLGALGLLFYFTWQGFAQLHRQREILDILQTARENNHNFPPPMDVTSQAMFEEFMKTFREAAYDFTHGGGTYNDNGYIIPQ